MEMVQVFLNYVGEPSVLGLFMLAFIVGLVQRRKIIVERLKTEAIKDTNSTNLKIAREKNKTDLKRDQLKKVEQSPSSSMTKVS
jgi:hypothetical protein